MAKYKKILLNIISSMMDPYYQGTAAELAYFFLLSMLPIVMALGQLSGIFSVSLDYIIEMLERYAPNELAEIVLPYLSNSEGSGGFSILFLLIALWLASKGIYSLIRISNYAYASPLPERKYARQYNYIASHLKAVVLTFLMLFVIISALLAVVFGNVIASGLTAMFGDTIFTVFLNDVWNIIGLPLAFSVYFLIVMIIYSSLPNGRIHLKRVIPGTIFTSTGIIVFSLGFMYYVSNFWNYGVIYGALSNIVILLLWFYVIGYILVIGIQVNLAFEKNKEQ